MVLFTQPEVGVLAGQDGWGEQTIDHIYHGAVGLLWVQKDAIHTHQCPHNLPKANGDLFWGPQSPLVYHPPGWYCHLLQGCSQWPLEAVFWRLEETRLKLKPSKFELFQWQIAYLGHIISAQGIATDEGKIEVTKRWPVLTNIMEVQSFLGFTGYYQGFIPKFMQVVQPLHKLTSGENAGKKKVAIQWNNRWQQAFDDLKRLCTTTPILTYVDFTQPSKLHTDACGSGLGAVLHQTHKDGTDAVISYTSRSLTKAKSHYTMHKLEFLTLKWAVVESFMNICMGWPLMYTPTITPMGVQLDQLQFPVILLGRRD